MTLLGGRGFAPDPTEEAYSAPQPSPLGRGLTGPSPPQEPTPRLSGLELQSSWSLTFAPSWQIDAYMSTTADVSTRSTRASRHR